MLGTDLTFNAIKSKILRPHWWKGYCLAAAAIALVAGGYVIWTGHIWEDYLITFRFSRNWARGNGLVFTPGERVHGFTSFLNTMIPAWVDWLAGGESIYPALNAYRCVCISALAAATVFLLDVFRHSCPSPAIAGLLLVGLVCGDFKTIAYTGNGQEIAFLWLFSAIGIHGLQRGIDQHWRSMAVAATGLMYTRPDGFIFATILGVAWLLVSGDSRWKGLLGLVKAAGLTTVAYLPWLAFVWSYYGTPVPHTVLAKVHAYGNVHEAVSFGDSLLVWAKALPGHALGVFEPIYPNRADWPAWMPAFSTLAALLAIVPLFLPKMPQLARGAAVCFGLGVCYLAVIHARTGSVFPWYFSFCSMSATISIACSFGALVSRFQASQSLRVLVGLPAVLVLLGACTLSWGGWQQIRLQQREIEWGIRYQIGRWLKSHIQPDDRVMLEPIGYIGFFSNAKLYDYPGLVSPAMVAVRNAGHRTIPEAAIVLKPEWLVLRKSELQAAERFEDLVRNYEVVKALSGYQRIAESPRVWGLGYLAFDCDYFILRRKTD